MNKTILVTGGTKGIGLAIVELFASHNFDVITTARNGQELEHLKVRLLKKHRNISVHIFAADFAIKNDVKSFLEFVDKLDCKIDVLVNNTGTFIQGQIHTEEEGVLEKLITVNLYSAYDISRAVLPKMIKAKTGHLFNICSTASITPYINGGSYCISKYALLGMTKVLREEMKEYKIKVTAVLPGATYTDSWSGTDMPADRLIPAQSIAESIFSIYSLPGATNVEEILIRPQLGDI